MSKAAAITAMMREHPDWGDRAIARAVGCSPTSVGKVRAGHTVDTSSRAAECPGAQVSTQRIHSESGQSEVDTLGRLIAADTGFRDQYAPAREASSSALSVVPTVEVDTPGPGFENSTRPPAGEGVHSPPASAGNQQGMTDGRETEFRERYAHAPASEATSEASAEFDPVLILPAVETPEPVLVDRGLKAVRCARILADTSGALLPMLGDHLAIALRAEAWRERRTVDGSLVGHASPAEWIEAPRPAGLGERVSVILASVERYSPGQFATISAALSAGRQNGE